MIFLFIIPGIPAALGNFFLPLQIGAKDVAFPRLNLLSWYLYITGAVLALISLFAGGGPPDTGWTFYAPYSLETGTNVSIAVLAAFVLGFSSILTGLNFITTMHRLRAPGMGWFRMPLFPWSLYATGWVQVLATPVVGITLVLIIVERAFGIGVFDPSKGGDPILYQHLFWIYSHPAVYIMILPAMGVVSEIIPTFARRTIFGYKAIAFSSMAIAAVGSLVWGHHMFTSGMGDQARVIFSFLTFLVAVPSGIKIFNWVATLYKGSTQADTPLLYILAFIFLFSIGGLTGLIQGSLATDIHIHDTAFVVGHFHYVMFGGTGFAFFGGLHYWFPKMFGKMYNERRAKIAWLILFVGFNLLYFPMLILGYMGMPRRYYDYLPRYQPLHFLSTIGSWILATGILLMFFNLLSSLKNGEKAGDNPFGGATLEWTTPSPPPLENFDEVPTVTGSPYRFKRGGRE
jgi:cytochrome c oxidase subunit 1